MSEINKPFDNNDIKKNWVVSSRFIFKFSVLCLIAFVVGCSTRLYNQRYKGPDKSKVNESSKYEPIYK
jgi:hypothetical protein